MRRLMAGYRGTMDALEEASDRATEREAAVTQPTEHGSTIGALLASIMAGK
jgi:hypothetical protein